jgi:hypothetical protein
MGGVGAENGSGTEERRLRLTFVIHIVPLELTLCIASAASLQLQPHRSPPLVEFFAKAANPAAMAGMMAEKKPVKLRTLATMAPMVRIARALQHCTSRLMASMKTLSTDTISMRKVGERMALAGHAPCTLLVELYFTSVRTMMATMMIARTEFRMYWMMR